MRRYGPGRQRAYSRLCVATLLMLTPACLGNIPTSTGSLLANTHRNGTAPRCTGAASCISGPSRWPSCPWCRSWRSSSAASGHAPRPPALPPWPERQRSQRAALMNEPLSSVARASAYLRASNSFRPARQSATRRSRLVRRQQLQVALAEDRRVGCRRGLPSGSVGRVQIGGATGECDYVDSRPVQRCPQLSLQGSGQGLPRLLGLLLLPSARRVAMACAQNAGP